MLLQVLHEHLLQFVRKVCEVKVQDEYVSNGKIKYTPIKIFKLLQDFEHHYSISSTGHFYPTHS